MLRSIELHAILTAFLISGAMATAQEKPAFFDTDFMRKTASAEIREVEIAKLALSRAKSADIKTVAERMAADHAILNKNLRATAVAANLIVPDKMSADDQAKYDELKEFSGDDFDRAYVKRLLIDQVDAMADFEKARKDAASPLVRGFADKSLPARRAHLDALRKLEETIR
ncbi:DUF4142 domain-containing protein [Zavarzinella formosa]|uniref:DUF4142 domain-containing protein n=1 Tax=Zavarzinella formosa TaxID=360055 RepID=UPI000311C654|nr:DUF4142 domain-containing protein [Zavarzinella formosa]